jgi:hypothetical protein
MSIVADDEDVELENDDLGAVLVAGASTIDARDCSVSSEISGRATGKCLYCLSA